VNLGEEFGAAACREVEEETGVRSTFRSLLALRHQHDVSFGRSDMYVWLAGWLAAFCRDDMPRTNTTGSGQSVPPHPTTPQLRCLPALGADGRDQDLPH